MSSNKNNLDEKTDASALDAPVADASAVGSPTASHAEFDVESLEQREMLAGDCSFSQAQTEAAVSNVVSENLGELPTVTEEVAEHTESTLDAIKNVEETSTSQEVVQKERRRLSMADGLADSVQVIGQDLIEARKAASELSEAASSLEISGESGQANNQEAISNQETVVESERTRPGDDQSSVTVVDDSASQPQVKPGDTGPLTESEPKTATATEPEEAQAEAEAQSEVGQAAVETTSNQEVPTEPQANETEVVDTTPDQNQRTDNEPTQDQDNSDPASTPTVTSNVTAQADKVAVNESISVGVGRPVEANKTGAFAGARASGSASAERTANGVRAAAEGDVFAGAEAQVVAATGTEIGGVELGLQGQAKASAGAGASGNATIEVNRDLTHNAQAEAEVFAGAQGEAAGKAKAAGGGLSASLSGEAKVDAGVGASGKVQTQNDGRNQRVGVEGGVFAGARAGVEGDAEVGGGAASVGGGVGARAGVGVDGKASGAFGADEVGVDVSLGGALIVGADVSIDVSANPTKIANGVATGVETVGRETDKVATSFGQEVDKTATTVANDVETGANDVAKKVEKGANTVSNTAKSVGKALNPGNWF